MGLSSFAYSAIVATIAGGFSLLISILAKDLKTSEFRQAWIDGLRNDIAEFISLFYSVTDMVRELVRAGKATKEDLNALLFEKDEHFRKLEMTFARIKLRVNPSEHIKLQSALLAIKGYVGSENMFDPKFAESLVDELVKESQVTLKCEWDRVKRGEPAFITAKRVSMLIIVTALSIGAVYVIGLFLS